MLSLKLEPREPTLVPREFPCHAGPHGQSLAGGVSAMNAKGVLKPLATAAADVSKLRRVSGFWDHRVPGANEPLARLCREWANKAKVDLTVDFITRQGDKLALTATAEGQARSGHDILQLSDWYAAAQADNLEPVDDLVTA
jgi:hypothetical protein